mmetsp:Transcript_21465/g.59050  ORF Transcript_21465/g.59050 Transcript_21465/m.59050 type:complete len:110 (-) Transcript_21465:299-628(-)
MGGLAGHPLSCTILGEDRPPSLPPPPAPPSPPPLPPGAVRAADAELKGELAFAEKAAIVGAGVGLLIVLALLCVIVALGRYVAAREKKYAGMMKLRTENVNAQELGSGA